MTYRNRGRANSAERREARRRMQQGTHNLVLLAQGERSTKEVATIAARIIHWWEDLRRGRLPVYGALLRFIDIAVALGTPRAILQHIPELLAWYINDRCDERAKRGHVTGEFRPARPAA